MSESEMVKMAVLLVPILVMFVSAVIGGIMEEIGNYKSKGCSDSGLKQFYGEIEIKIKPIQPTGMTVSVEEE